MKPHVDNTGRRRSLLRRTRTGRTGGRFPLWKAIIVADTFVLFLTAAGQLFTAGTLTGFATSAAITTIFCIPITVLAFYGTRMVAHVANRAWRVALLIVTWMASGMVGAAIAYGALRISLGDRVVPNFNPGDALPIANGILAVVVGAGIVLLELVRTQHRQRKSLLHEQSLLTAELRSARNVQQSLLPPEDLQLPGYDISGMTEPAVEIGGDYFDYLTFADGTKGVVVADASGKGVPAALLMAKFQGMAQALSIHVASTTEFFIGLNDTLTLRLDRRNFITVGMITIDFDDRCTFYRAGHNPLLVYSTAEDRVTVFRPRGMALGLTHGTMRRDLIEPVAFTMAEGDMAFLFSDGLTEAENEHGEAFGDERAAEAMRIAAALGLTAEGARTAIMQRLSDFVGGAEQHDDITMVIVRKV